MTSPTNESQVRKERLEDVLIVDVDVHVRERPGEMAPYCEMPWRRALEALADRPEGTGYPGLSPTATSLAYSPPFPGGITPRRVLTARQMREELDELKIDIGILFPDHLLRINVIPSPEFAAAVARAYNAWLVEKWTTQERGLLGCIVVAPQAPDAAVKEIEKYANDPTMVGICIPTAAMMPLAGDPKYFPIYEAAEATNLPVCFHSSTIVHPVYPFQLNHFATALGRHSVGHTFSTIVNLVSLIEHGVPVRFPKVKFCFTEAGVAWIPWIMYRMDKEYIVSRREVPFLEKPPSEYVKDFYYATQPIEEPNNPHDLVALMKMYNGEDRTMFASDWPHPDFDHPREVFQLPMTPEMRRKVMGENALAFFNIDREGRSLR